MSYRVKAVASDGAPIQSTAETAAGALRRADQLTREGCDAVVVHSLATGEIWGADHFATFVIREVEPEPQALSTGAI